MKQSRLKRSEIRFKHRKQVKLKTSSIHRVITESQLTSKSQLFLIRYKKTGSFSLKEVTKTLSTKAKTENKVIYKKCNYKDNNKFILTEKRMIKTDLEF